MGYKRYIIIVISFFLAIALDAFIFTTILGTPYGEIPNTYHIGNIIMLALALTILGDHFFKGDVLR